MKEEINREFINLLRQVVKNTDSKVNGFHQKNRNRRGKYIEVNGYIIK